MRVELHRFSSKRFSWAMGTFMFPLHSLGLAFLTEPPTQLHHVWQLPCLLLSLTTHTPC